MENNKLMKVREGIFSKIFKKIKLLFFKNSPKEETKEEKQEIIKSNFKEEIKTEVEIDNSYQKEQFMNNIRENPSLLENFSLERLIKIRKYWEDRVKKKEEILINMKKNS